MTTLRVVVVEDSPVAAELLRRVIDAAPDLEVVSVCHTVDELEKLRLPFDVITLDLMIRERSGLSALRDIARRAPVVVVSDAADRSALAKEAIAQGAFAFIAKSSLSKAEGEGRLRERLRDAARGRQPTIPPVVIWIGSTGAIRAYRQLGSLINALPASQLVLQHLPEDGSENFAQWLSDNGIDAQVATEGAQLKAGHLLVAPAGKHLLLGQSGRLRLWNGPAHEGHVPSGTLLLRSAAENVGDRTIAVILSGMGRDGAAAVPEIVRAGGAVLVQHPEDCVISSMPDAAWAASPQVRKRRVVELPNAIRRLIRVYDNGGSK